VSTISRRHVEALMLHPPPEQSLLVVYTTAHGCSSTPSHRQKKYTPACAIASAAASTRDSRAVIAASSLTMPHFSWYSCVSLVADVFDEHRGHPHCSFACMCIRRAVSPPSLQNLRAGSKGSCAQTNKSRRCAPRLDLRVLAHSAVMQRASISSSAAGADARTRVRRALW
jgi:hypothetical protein